MNLTTTRNRGSHFVLPLEVAVPRLRDREKKAPTIISRGAVSVKIYQTRWYDKKRAKHYKNFVLAWRDARGRHREKRSSLDIAKSRADEICIAILNGNTALLEFSHEDKAAYLRSRQITAHLPEPLELICSKWVEATRLADFGMTPLECIEFARANRPASATDKNAVAIYDEMLLAREKDGASKNTLDDLRSRVKKFATYFNGPVMHITANQINDWLRKLPGSRRTRNNYRGNILDYFRYARSAGYVPKGWDPLADVPRVKNEPVRIEIFTPEELTKILAARVAIESRNKRAKRFIPFLVIGAFAGLRSEEMCAPGLPVLDWRDIDLDKMEIHVHADVARKKGYDRITPIQPNLAAWLKQYARTSGPVCEVDNSTNALESAAAEARIKWKDNGLRKSFISYRLAITKNIGTVATEAGTSPDRIRHNYKKTVPEREAKKWNDIYPTSSEILQVNFKGF